MPVDLFKKYGINPNEDSTEEKPVDLFKKYGINPGQTNDQNKLSELKDLSSSMMPGVAEITAMAPYIKQALYGAAEPERNIVNAIVPRSGQIQDFPRPTSVPQELARMLGTGAATAATFELPAGAASDVTSALPSLLRMAGRGASALGQGAYAGGLGGSSPSAQAAKEGAITGGVLSAIPVAGTLGLRGLGYAARAFKNDVAPFFLKTPEEVAAISPDFSGKRMDISSSMLNPSKDLVIETARNKAKDIYNDLLSGSDNGDIYSPLISEVDKNKNALREKFNGLFGDIKNKADSISSLKPGAQEVVPTNYQKAIEDFEPKTTRIKRNPDDEPVMRFVEGFKINKNKKALIEKFNGLLGDIKNKADAISSSKQEAQEVVPKNYQKAIEDFEPKTTRIKRNPDDKPVMRFVEGYKENPGNLSLDEAHEIQSKLIEAQRDNPGRLGELNKLHSALMQDIGDYYNNLSPDLFDEYKNAIKMYKNKENPGNLSFDEAHEIQSKLREAQRDNPGRSEALNKLHSALMQDIGDYYNNLSPDLFDEYKNARKMYKDEYVPYLKDRLSNILNGKVDESDIGNFLKSSANKKVVSDLSENGKKLLLAHLLGSNTGDFLNDEESINPVKLSKTYGSSKSYLKREADSGKIGNIGEKFNELKRILKSHNPDYVTSTGKKTGNINKLLGLLGGAGAKIGDLSLASPYIRESYAAGRMLPMGGVLSPQTLITLRNAIAAQNAQGEQ